MLQSDRGIRVFLAAGLGPATLQILVKDVAVNHPKAITLAKIFDFNDGGQGKRGMKREFET